MERMCIMIHLIFAFCPTHSIRNDPAFHERDITGVQMDYGILSRHPLDYSLCQARIQIQLRMMNRLFSFEYAGNLLARGKFSI